MGVWNWKPMPYDVFLSHSSQDRSLCDAVCNHLESAGIRCWVAPRDVLPGEDYASQLLRAIDACPIFLLVLTNRANQSRHVIKEVERAVNKGRAVLPFRLEETQLTESLEYFLSSDHWLDAITPPLEAHIEKLVGVVKRLLELHRQPVAGPAASPQLASAESLVICPICGDKNLPNQVFRCTRCGSDNLCRNHRDPALLMCGSCAKAKRETEAQQGTVLKARETRRQQEEPAARREDKQRREAQRTGHASLRPARLLLWVLAAGVGLGIAYLGIHNRLKVTAIKDQAPSSTQPSTLVSTPTPTPPQPFTNRIGMAFVPIPAGSFQMGSVKGDPDEKPVHQVTISHPFYMAKFPVTQAQWQAVMGSNPSYFKKSGLEAPVEQVSWDDAQAFLAKLNEAHDGWTYRLPTEAEWEYACRAGTTGDCYGELNAIAWHGDNSGEKTHPVGQKQPNAWGLYDMLGNVFQWCQDRYGERYYSHSSSQDPQGPSDGSDRVQRGGCWGFAGFEVNSAVRLKNRPTFRGSGSGFRVACSAPRTP